MCHQCDYAEMLKNCGLSSTPNRLSLMEIVGNSTSPLSAQDVFDTLSRTRNVSRVTVYRILDILVEKELLERISGGDRSFRYGMAPNANHQPHPHFYCSHCGNMECLNPESIHVDTDALQRTFPGLIRKVEIRVDGVCKSCLRLQRKNSE